MRPRVAGAALALALAWSTAGLGHSAAGPAVAPSAARASGHHIDTSDKAEVRRAWQERWRDNLHTPSGWIGDTTLCLAGLPSQEAQDATLEAINFVRAMAGLDRVGLGDGLSSKAQEAALIMDANDRLSHDPPKSWDCWSETGDEAAGHSNLAWTSGTMDAGEAIELYMDDLGRHNKAVGHRRWLLRPSARTFGNGMTDTTSAIWVIGPTSHKKRNPRWVSWPSPGWFPSGLEPHGRWSLSSGDDDADFGAAKVVVRRVHGARLDVTTYRPARGYAKPTLVFGVKGLQDTGSYRVTVRGIKKAASSRRSWVVKLFDPSR